MLLIEECKILNLRQNSNWKWKNHLFYQDIKDLENIDTDHVSLKGTDKPNQSALIGQNSSCPNPDW